MKYEEITVGAQYTFDRVINQKDVEQFAQLTGDYNPLHLDEAFGARSLFRRNLVHGMLAGSLFSTLIGMHCPGASALYMSQTLDFVNPIFSRRNTHGERDRHSKD